MAKRKTDSAAPVASEPEVSGVVSVGTAPNAQGYGVLSAEAAKIIPSGAIYNSASIMATPAERDLNILIEAQRIRRDPARFMAAKALPQAQKHYIV